jgi:hypothetical protein
MRGTWCDVEVFLKYEQLVYAAARLYPNDESKSLDFLASAFRQY